MTIQASLEEDMNTTSQSNALALEVDQSMRTDNSMLNVSANSGTPKAAKKVKKKKKKKHPSKVKDNEHE